MPAHTINPMARAATAATTPSGVQLATAFDGQLEPLKTPFGYRLSAFLVFAAMLVLPMIYLAIVLATVLGLWWYAVHATILFSALPAGRAFFGIGIIYVTPLAAGALLILFMILPWFWRAQKPSRPMWVDRKEQPLLFAYIDKMCDTMHAPRPVRIDLVPTANASAHIDNGMLGLVHRRLVLTIGLPLAQEMDLRQFTGVLAHELGHFAQGGSMRLSYAVARINNWFLRMAYTRSGVDVFLSSLMQHGSHWSIVVVVGICKLVLLAARLLLKLMAILSHGLSMHLSRHAEYDADLQAARIVGSEPIGEALQALPFLDQASRIAVSQAQSGWKKKRLPDDLIQATSFYSVQLPETLKNQITAKLLALDTNWFDTHPPLFQRIGALKKARLHGVLKLNAPATCLFKDFDELCKLTTIQLYQTALGEMLQPEHLFPTDISQLAPVQSAIATSNKRATRSTRSR